MPDSTTKMNRLLQAIQSGSEEAAQEFVRKYGDILRRIIRRRMEPRLRSTFDSCDFLQDVFTSFFTKPPAPEAFPSPKALLNYLAVMARHKVGEELRRRLVRPGYNLNREKSLDGSARFEALGQQGPEPTPSEAVMADERWEEMKRRMEAGHQKILELLRQGYTHNAIAEQLGIHPKHVQRLIRHLSRRDSQR